MNRSPQHQSLVDQLVKRGGIDTGPSEDSDVVDEDHPLTEVKFVDWQVFVGPPSDGDIENEIEVAVLIEHEIYVDDDQKDDIYAFNETLPEGLILEVQPYERSAIWLSLSVLADKCDSPATSTALDELLVHASAAYARFGVFPNAPKITRLLPE